MEDNERQQSYLKSRTCQKLTQKKQYNREEASQQKSVLIEKYVSFLEYDSKAWQYFQPKNSSKTKYELYKQSNKDHNKKEGSSISCYE